MNKKSMAGYLDGCHLFDNLDAEHLKILIGYSSDTLFEVGDTIIKRGNRANLFYIICDGLVAIEMSSGKQKTVQIQTLGTGGVLGWSWLFPPYEWHFDAKAVKRTRAIVFDARSIRAQCEEDKSFGYELMKQFSKIAIERLQATRLQLIDACRASCPK